MTSALREAFEEGSTVLDPAHLAEITEDEAAGLLHGAVRIGEIPLLAERTAILQEVGKALVATYAERPERLVEEAAGSAERLIRSLIARFPSFRDEATYGGERIGFYKRAQILVADLCGCFGGTGPGRFHDLPTLTAFADYKLPQILRHVGVVAYAPDLAARVDRRAWIDAGSPEEVEIRAATIVAVERLKEALQALGRPLLAIEIDWLLWQAAQRRPGMRPHHRTLTTRY